MNDELIASLRVRGASAGHWLVERERPRRCGGCHGGCATGTSLRLPTRWLAGRHDDAGDPYGLELRVSRRGLTVTALALYGLPLAAWLATLWALRDAWGEAAAGGIGLLLAVAAFVVLSGGEGRWLRQLKARALPAGRSLEIRMSRTDIRPAGDDK